MPDPFAIAGLNDALADIQDAQRHGNPHIRLLGVILSGVDKRTRLASTLNEYVEQISLLLDSRVLRDQQLNECRQQRLASLADVVYKLEEPEVEREFLLGNAPMRTKPAAQQRPKAFHGIYMDFTQTVAIVIACEFASSVVDTLMVVAP